jgi:uncharacterized membrane protein
MTSAAIGSQVSSDASEPAQLEPTQGVAAVQPSFATRSIDSVRSTAFRIRKISLEAWAIFSAAVVEATVLSWIQGQNYLGYHTTNGDLGNYNQAYYTATHGQGFFYYTANIPGGSGGTIWGVHFIPTLVLLAPFYALASSPVTLMVLRQFALTLGAVPLYGIARVYFQKGVIPVVFASAYLASPLIMANDWNSFDPESFIPVLLLCSIYFFTVGRLWPFVAFWILSLGTIESAPPLLLAFAIGGMVGTYLVPSLSPYWTAKQQRRPLVIAAGLAAVWIGVAFAVLQIVGRGGAFGATYATRYQVLGATSLPDVVVRSVTDPHAALNALQWDGSAKLLFVAIIVLASGVVWLAGGLRYLLPIAAFLFLVLLSSLKYEFVIGSQYPGLVLAFLFAGSVEGAALLNDVFQRKPLDHRHRELFERLADRTRALAGLLPSLGLSRELEAKLLGDLRRAAASLAANRTGEAERILNSALRSIELASRARPSTGPDGLNALVSVEGAADRSNLPLRRSFRRIDRSRALTLGLVTLIAGAILLSTTFASPLLSNPAAGASDIVFGLEGPTAQTSVVSSVLSLVPTSGSILTTPHIFPSVSNRPNAYVLRGEKYQLLGNETIADVVDWMVNSSNYVAIDYAMDRPVPAFLQDLANLSGFGVRAADNGTYLFERGWTGAPTLWAPISNYWPGGELNALQGSYSTDYSVAGAGTVYHPPGGTVGTQIWAGPRFLYLPPGNYTATFHLELRAPNPGKQLSLAIGRLPAVVTDSVYLNEGDRHFHEVSIGPAANMSSVLASSTVKTTNASTNFQPVNVSLSFSWPTVGYVSFPGTLLSATMSVYLVGVSVVQTSALV